MWHFLLTQRGGDLWAADCMNQFCSEKYKSTWSHYENNFLRLEKLEVWPSKNLSFRNALITPQKDGPAQRMCVVPAQRMCVVPAETSERRVSSLWEGSVVGRGSQ